MSGYICHLFTKRPQVVFRPKKANRDILNDLATNEFIVDPFSSECFPVSLVSMETTQSLGVIQHNLFLVWILNKRKIITDKTSIRGAWLLK